MKTSPWDAVHQRGDGVRGVTRPSRVPKSTASGGLNDIEAELAALREKLGALESDDGDTSSEDDSAEDGGGGGGGGGSSTGGDSDADERGGGASRVRRAKEEDEVRRGGKHRRGKREKKSERKKKRKEADMTTADGKKKRKKRDRREREKKRTTEDEERSKVIGATPSLSSDGDGDGDGDGDSDSSELEAIAPLPAHLLPEHNAYSGKNVGKRRKKLKTGFLATAEAAKAAAGATIAAPEGSGLAAILSRRRDMPRCEVCAKEFTSQGQLDEHNRGKAHLRAARAARGEGGRRVGAPEERRPGGRGAGPPRPAPGPKPPPGVPHCALCRKTFTSAAQLAEHNGGKWHMMRIRGELAPSRKPYNAS